MHTSYLRHRDHLYLKVSLISLVLAVTLYWATRPPGGGNGGTAYGYTLGALSTALILWLMALGIRKRTYTAGGVMLREWLSAHVYLGLLLVALVPLHSGFQLGGNVHTLAYALLCVVVVSGIAGVVLYGAVPSQITANRTGEKLAALIEQVETLDGDCRTAAESLPDDLAEIVLASIDSTRVGGSLTQQLRGRDSATRFALERVRERTRAVGEEHREHLKRLVGLLAAKRDLVARIERDIRLKALLDLWLIIHVPAAVATVAAVAVHVWVVFYYR